MSPGSKSQNSTSLDIMTSCTRENGSIMKARRTSPIVCSGRIRGAQIRNLLLVFGGGLKKWKPDDVADMRERKEQVNLSVSLSANLFAELAEARPGIEIQSVAGVADLHTRSVATVFDGPRTRRGYAPSHSQESDEWRSSVDHLVSHKESI